MGAMRLVYKIMHGIKKVDEESISPFHTITLRSWNKDDVK